MEKITLPDFHILFFTGKKELNFLRVLAFSLRVNQSLSSSVQPDLQWPSKFIFDCLNEVCPTSLQVLDLKLQSYLRSSVQN